MNGQKKKSGVLSGLAWSFGERICAQLISTIVTIILARLLDPNLYGIIAIVTVIINFLNVFVNGGFSTAIVQKKDTDDADYNSCFTLSFIVSWIVYGILIFISPLVAKLYKIPDLRILIIVLGIRLPIAAINSIQQAIIQRNMKFKNFFIATIWGTLVSAVVGITLAYKGYGVWALVAQYLSNIIIDTIVLFFINDWKPKFMFSTKRIREIWNFGGKVFGANLVDTTLQDIRSLLIGKVFGPADLSYYNHGQKYTSLIVENVNSSISKVMLPVYSKKQSDYKELLNAMRLSVRVATYVLTPLLIGFAVVSECFVRVVLTEKWLGCVPFICIFCVAYWFRPLCSICAQGILAIGKSAIILKQMLMVHFMSILTILIAIFSLKSVVAIAFSYLLCEVISLFLFSYYAKKSMGYTYKCQLMDVLPHLAIGIVMGVCVYFIEIWLSGWTVLKLLILVASGAIIYIALSYITSNSAFAYILKKIKGIVNK